MAARKSTKKKMVAPAPKKPIVMSPWLTGLLAAIARAERPRVDRLALEQALQADDRIESLVRHYPSASDEEIAQLSLPSLWFGWDDVILAQKTLVHEAVGEVAARATHLGWEDEEFFELDVEDQAIKVKATIWGTMYEYDPNDQFSTRVELPALGDLHDGELRRAFEKTGAKADVTWKFEDDPNYDADVVTFPMTLTWRFDEQALSQTYGAHAFLRGVLARVPRARAEVAAEQGGGGAHLRVARARTRR